MVENAIRKLQEEHKEYLATALRKLNDREKHIRIGLGIVCAIIAIGCAFGILTVNNLSKERRAQGCWADYNSRIALRALVSESSAPHYPNVSDPQLAALLAQSKRQGKLFKKFAFQSLPLEKCRGRNPNPPAPAIERLGK